MGRNKKELVPDGTSKRLLAVVSGMNIYSDSVYVITGKSDRTAPDGFQERGISKAPFVGNKSVVPCSYDVSAGVYDTGFFTSSTCFRGWEEEEKRLEIERRVSNIKYPYEEATGKDLSQNNYGFWDAVTVDNYDGRLFYTNDVIDLFDLYVSLQSKMLTPKDDDGNPDFKESMYCVEDKTTAVDIKKQRQLDKTEIVYQFMSMLRGTSEEKSNIKDLLMYLDVIPNVNIDDSMVQYSFTNWMEQKNTNIDDYKDAYSRLISTDQSSKGIQTIAFHRIIKELAYSDIIKLESNGIMFDNTPIGPDYKTAAINIVEDKSLLDVKSLLLEAYNNMKTKQEKIANGVNV